MCTCTAAPGVPRTPSRTDAKPPGSDLQIEQSCINCIKKHTRHHDWCIGARDKVDRELKQHRREMLKKKGATSKPCGLKADRFLADSAVTNDWSCIEKKTSKEVERARNHLFPKKSK